MLVPVKLIEGIESQQYVNHFSQFLLLAELYPLLQKTQGRPRVVSLSSMAHEAADGNLNYWAKHESEQEYQKVCKDSAKSFVPYGTSKLANILHMQKMAELDPTIGFYAVHPGVVDTELFRYWNQGSPILSRIMGCVFSLFMKTSFHGAQTSLYCALSPELETSSGFYYSDVAKGSLKAIGKDTAKMNTLREKLWQISLDYTNCNNFIKK